MSKKRYGVNFRGIPANSPGGNKKDNGPFYKICPFIEKWEHMVQALDERRDLEGEPPN